MSAKVELAAYIRVHGPIGTVRVSTAQAKGLAKRYAYWGAVRYEITLRRDGMPTHVALERASSDRRSYRLAEKDADHIADREDRIYVEWGPGALDEQQCKDILERLHRWSDSSTEQNCVTQNCVTKA